MLNIYIEKKDNVWTPNYGVRRIITGNHCMQQCYQNHFEAAALVRNLGFFMILTRKEGSGLRACPRPHESVYHRTAVREKLQGTPYVKQVIILPLLVFYGHGYLHRRVWSEPCLTNYGIPSTSYHMTCSWRRRYRLPGRTLWRPGICSCPRSRLGNCKGVEKAWADEWGGRKQRWWGCSTDMELLPFREIQKQ